MRSRTKTRRRIRLSIPSTAASSPPPNFPQRLTVPVPHMPLHRAETAAMTPAAHAREPVAFGVAEKTAHLGLGEVPIKPGLSARWTQSTDGAEEQAGVVVASH